VCAWKAGSRRHNEGHEVHCHLYPALENASEHRSFLNILEMARKFNTEEFVRRTPLRDLRSLAAQLRFRVVLWRIPHAPALGRQRSGICALFVRSDGVFVVAALDVARSKQIIVTGRGSKRVALPA